MRRSAILLFLAACASVTTGAALVACSSAGSGGGSDPTEGDGDSSSITADSSNDTGGSSDSALGSDSRADAIPEAATDGGVAWTPVALSCSTAAPGGPLQDLGHQKEVTAVHRTADRAIGSEQGGGWILWDIATGAELAGSETGSVSEFSPSVFLVVGTDVEMRATSDGHVVTKLPKGYSKYGIARDGSYAWGASKSALKIWSPSGAEVASRSGNYANVSTFAAPAELRVARGAAGASVIERVTPAGVSSVGPAFGGTFHSWFTDGAHFLTTVGTTNVLVHDTTGVLVNTLPVGVSSQDKLVGQNAFVWRFKERTPGYPLDVFAFDGDGTAVFSQAFSVLAAMTASADEIGVLPYGTGEVTIVHLDAVGGITSASHPTPFSYLTSFGATAEGSWAIGTKTGSLLVHGDAASSTAERSLGCGRVLSISGASTGRVAVATASKHVLVADLPSGALVADLPFASSDVQLSADGSVIAAMATTHGNQYLPDRTLDILALPSGTTLATFPFAYDPVGWNRFGFHLSANGARVATSFKSPVATPFGRNVIDLATGDTILANTGFKPTPRLSPNGERVAMTDYEPADSKSMSTRIYNGGSLVAAVPGAAIGWLDDNRLLVQEYGYSPASSSFVYAGSKIYDAAGALITSPALPELGASDIVDSTHVFARRQSQLYDASTGKPVGPRMPAWDNGGGIATGAGSFLVGVFGRRIGRVAY
ncbi:MAG: hypothetical protein JST00_18440 [Deltaproteobacteria bacterium]|nr:hypothetical protein [Deltaproteobacteria bacterium]